MPADLERKRARDLARYHAKREAGTYHRTPRKPRPPMTRVERKAKDPRTSADKNAWRDVGRAFERFMRLPVSVQDRVLTAARS